MRTFAHEPVETACFHQGLPAFYLDKQPQEPPLSSPQLVNKSVRYVRVDIQEDMLHRLIHQGALVVENLRGLDQQTQANIKALLLDSLRVHK